VQRGEHRIYLIMEFCSGGDLTNYIKKRGKVEGLEYVPTPGAAPQYYPHPRSGGLDEIVVRSFLRQLGELCHATITGALSHASSARALKFLRQRNLVHRDIKPQVPYLSDETMSILIFSAESSSQSRTSRRAGKGPPRRRAHAQGRRLWIRSFPPERHAGRDVMWLSVSGSHFPHG
jgi:serine/threonine protein kinase